MSISDISQGKTCIRWRIMFLQYGNVFNGANKGTDKCDYFQLGSRCYVFNIVHNALPSHCSLPFGENGKFGKLNQFSEIKSIISEQFEVNIGGDSKGETQIRGLGTDVAIVSSMVFLAQFILSICMGTIVKLSGTTTAVVSVASFLSLCGAISATQIMYLNL